jgi:SAM-dependent methyltransferase
MDIDAPLAAAQLFGQIDIYVFDQILRRRIAPGMRVLDAGCGGGRNLVYLLRQGYPVMALDQDPQAVAAVRHLASQLAPSLEAENFRVESIEASSFDDGCADVVLCNAVLHFSRGRAHFAAQLDGLWRLLAPGGLFFARLGSRITLEDRVHALGDGRYREPGGGERYLVDTQELLDHGERLGGQLLDPIKTTHVQGLRCMTTWVLRKET